MPFLLASSLVAAAQTLRIATWNVALDRKGPGLLVRDIDSRKDAQVEAVLRVLTRLDADVLLLTAVDYDRGLVAASLIAGRLAELGAPYPHLFALRPNTGMATGLDLDGDGRTGGPGDAQGWGRFAGQAGMLVLSRLPVEAEAVRDFSTFLWADLPGALLPPMTDAVRAVQRLSTTGHWEVPLLLPGGGRLRLLAFHATPPVFDGPEDRNGRRNHDETAFWLALLDGRMPVAPPAPPFVLLGDGNLDPVDGDGRREAMRALLSHPALVDPLPKGEARRHDEGQAGDPALDTALYAFGGLRVDLVLPSRDLLLRGAGVLWPEAGDLLLDDLAAASRHFPVWVDVALPP